MLQLGARQTKACDMQRAHAMYQTSSSVMPRLPLQRARGHCRAANAPISRTCLGGRSGSQSFLSSTSSIVVSNRQQPAPAVSGLRSTTKVTRLSPVMYSRYAAEVVKHPLAQVGEGIMVFVSGLFGGIGAVAAICVAIFAVFELVRRVLVGPPTVTRLRVAVRSKPASSGLPKDLRDSLNEIAGREHSTTHAYLRDLLADTAHLLHSQIDGHALGAVYQQTGLPLIANIQSKMQALAKFERDTINNGALLKEAITTTLQTGSDHTEEASQAAGSGSTVNQFVIVTLLVATKCSVKLPQEVNTLAGFKHAFDILREVEPGDIDGVQLYWTPQASGQYYTAREVIANYPDMQSMAITSYGGFGVLASKFDGFVVVEDKQVLTES
eukprot:GHUV01017246.1.p1 GENE.GHUV01017246.1~~GHUV01017246.1.p1  ORF type:complete len:382 (+),score=72.80 GHUV01017246.1:254-1399(+)